MLRFSSRLPAQAILIIALSLRLGIAQGGLHSGIRSIFSGSQARETCVLLADQRGYCWGDEGREQPLLRIGQDIKAFALGTFFGCALTSDGNVSCWGSNGAGQLGDGGVEDSYDIPRRVQFRGRDFGDVSAVTAGNSHACALRYGQAWCWGANQFKQLGNSIVSSSYSTSPVPVMVTSTESLANLHAISAGGEHTCALLNDDTGACWGLDSFGQLGNAQSSYGLTFGPQTIVVDSGGLKRLVMGGDSIGSGDEHTCALVSDIEANSVACWGDNGDGQLGIGSRDSKSTAFPVSDENGKISDATGLAVGGDASCAILTDTTVRCWGNDSALQLGIAGAGRDQEKGVVLLASRRGDAFSGAIQLVAGARHFCVRNLQDEIYCWGSNAWGEISENSSFGDTDTPTKVAIDAPIFYDNFQGD